MAGRVSESATCLPRREHVANPTPSSLLIHWRGITTSPRSGPEGYSSTALSQARSSHSKLLIPGISMWFPSTPLLHIFIAPRASPIEFSTKLVRLQWAVWVCKIPTTSLVTVGLYWEKLQPHEDNDPLCICRDRFQLPSIPHTFSFSFLVLGSVDQADRVIMCSGVFRKVLFWF